MIDILQRAVKDDPDIGSMSFGHGILEALIVTFPCPQK
jgi:hypothetical protein